MKKTYTKKQITETIKYWSKVLESMNELSTDEDFEKYFDNIPAEPDLFYIDKYEHGFSASDTYDDMQLSQLEQDLDTYETYIEELDAYEKSLPAKLQNEEVNDPYMTVDEIHGKYYWYDMLIKDIKGVILFKALKDATLYDDIQDLIMFEDLYPLISRGYANANKSKVLDIIDKLESIRDKADGIKYVQDYPQLKFAWKTCDKIKKIDNDLYDAIAKRFSIVIK